MEAQSEVFRLLSENGARLKRKANHEVWELSSGRSFTTPKSASDWRSWANCLADLKVELGLSKRGQQKESVLTPKSRRNKSHHTRQPRYILTPNTFDDKGKDFKDVLSEAVYGAPQASHAENDQILVYHPRRTRRYSPPQHGEVKTYSQEEIALINQVQKQQGDAGVQVVLNTLRYTDFSITALIEPNPIVGDEYVNPIALRKQIESWKIKVVELKKESQDLMAEAAEAEKNAVELEHTIKNAEQFALSLDKTANLIGDSIASKLQSLSKDKNPKANDGEKVDGRRFRTSIRYLDEAVKVFEASTEPVKMTLKQVLNAIVANTKEERLNPHSLYTALANQHKDPDARIIKIGTSWTLPKYRSAFETEADKQQSVTA